MDDPKANLSPVWTHLTELVITHAEGAMIYDSSGQAYLDFTSGIGVTNTGHCHPKVVEAIREQAGRLLHGQVNIIYHAPLLELVKELRTVVPSALDTFFFSNSGAEAVEASVKLARQATGKPNIIVFQGSFHGRTVGTMSLTTSKTIYRARYGPLMAGVFVAPYPYSYYYGWSDDDTTDFCLRELRHLLATQTSPAETAAVLIEPVLGEGGYVVPPTRFMRGLRELCDEYGLLLIADEIQSGFGRTGRFFAVEHFAVVPDILIMAKGLASGLPLSGIAARGEWMSRWEPGSHGGTYGGNAVACAAAVATIRVLRDEGLVENAARMGEHLMERLRAVQREHPAIGDVRGLGLMVAVEFNVPDASDHGKGLVSAVQKACLDEKLILLNCGAYSHIIRWIPPLVATRDQIDHAVDVFARALEKVTMTQAVK
jgi:4-aminobutyrate aminotransferase